jgi:drug/metabolite transporter (DMT)-like permease
MSGLARVALASVLFGFGGVFATLAYERGANVAAVLSVRALALLPWLAAFLFAARRVSARGIVGQLVLMALLAAGAALTFFTAVSRMSPALVILIFYMYPVLVFVCSHALGWSYLTGFKGVALSLTLVGVVLTVGLPASETDALAIVLSVVNAFLYAAYLLIAQSALRRVDAVTTIAFVGGLSSILLLAGAFLSGIELPSGDGGMASLVAFGLVSVLFPHVLLMSGISRLGSSWSSLVTCLEIVTAVVATAIILDEPLGRWAIAGGTLIVAGGVAAPLLGSRHASITARSRWRLHRADFPRGN